MKIQRSLMALCLISLCSVNAHAQSAYAEISFQSIDAGTKSNGTAFRGILGTSYNDWLDIEGMIGVSSKEAKAEDEVISGVNVQSQVSVDRYYGVYLKPKFKMGDAELFGRMGFASAQITAKASGQQGDRYVYRESSGPDSGISYGFGANYAVTKSIAIAADFMTVAEDIDAMSVGIRYSF